MGSKKIILPLLGNVKYRRGRKTTPAVPVTIAGTTVVLYLAGVWSNIWLKINSSQKNVTIGRVYQKQLEQYLSRTTWK